MAERGAAQELVELIQEHDLSRDHSELIYVLRDAQRGAISNSMADFYIAHIEELLEERRRVPVHLFEIPSDDELNADGAPDVVLGHVRGCDDVPFGLRLQERARTIVVAGNAGSGKTTLVRGAIEAVCDLAKQRNRPIPMLVFDSKAREYGGMRRLLGGAWKHYSVHVGSWLGFNAPAGVPSQVWINHISTLFAAAAGVNFGTSVLAEAMTTALQSTGRWPTLRTLINTINRNPKRFSKKEAYAQTVGHQGSAAVLASEGLFDTNQGIDADLLISAGESAVFDIGNIQPPFLRMFIVWLIVAQVLVARMHRGHRVDGTECLIVVDEADQIVSEQMEARFPDGISPLGVLAQHGRELGVSGIIGLHALGNASRAILTNATCHFMFNFSDAQSIQEASRTLLVPRGAEQIFPALRPGECVCRLAQTSWPMPFLGTARFIAPDRSIATPNYELGIPIAAGTERAQPSQTTPVPTTSVAASACANPFVLTGSAQPSELAHKLLSAWALHPFTPIVVLWKSIGTVTDAAAVAARVELSKLTLAEFTDWRIGKKNLGLMVPTAAGWECLNRTAPILHGGGGIEHRHAEQWIARVGSLRGYKVRMEAKSPGSSHRVDTIWQKDGHARAFEVIVTCDSNLPDHLRACLIQSTAIQRVTIIAGTQIELQKQRMMIEDTPDLAPVLDHIDYESIDIYLGELFPRDATRQYNVGEKSSTRQPG